MRLIAYLPHGPAISTPATERVRDGIAAQHRNENAFLSRTGFALIICIFVLLTLAVPAFGHDTREIRNGDRGCERSDLECETHTINARWDEFIRNHPREDFGYANSHWHMTIDEEDIGGWDKCVAEAYVKPTPEELAEDYYKEGDYNLVGGNCSGGTSTDLITQQQNDPNNSPVFNGPVSASVPENTPTTQKLVMVKATDSDSEDNPVTISLGGADASHFSLEPSPGKPLERDLKFTIVPDYENPQDSNEDNVYVVVVTATSGTGDRYRETTKTITITVTNVQEPGDPVTPITPPVITPQGTDDTPGGTGGTPSTLLTPLPKDVTLSFTKTRYEASEDDKVLEFSVQLSKEVSQEAMVTYSTQTGTATTEEDYEATGGALTFPAGTTRRTIRVPIIDDNVVEQEETFTVRLINSNATLGISEATGVIADNDLPVVVVTTNQTVVEEGETVTFTLTRSGDLSMPLTVPVSITERGAFLADGAPTEATFAANAATTALQVATVDDEVDEENGAVTATIADGETYQVGDAASATVEITDNDEPDEVETKTDTDVETETDTDVDRYRRPIPM